jgi:hypothetical protein
MGKEDGGPGFVIRIHFFRGTNAWQELKIEDRRLKQDYQLSCHYSRSLYFYCTIYSTDGGLVEFAFL